MHPSRRDRAPQSLGRACRARLAAHIALIALAMAVAHAARAQAGGSVSITSEFSARGVALGDGRPAAQLSLTYDGAQGWYAGTFAVPHVRAGERAGVTELITYGGYAHQLASGLSWEAGASSTVFQHASSYNFREVYAGLASDHIGARLYLAPAYYGYPARVAYGELNTAWPLLERVRLIGHLGVLHGLHGQQWLPRDHADLRLAIGYELDDCNVQLAWLHNLNLGADTVRGYYRPPYRAPRALQLSASYSF